MRALAIAVALALTAGSAFAADAPSPDADKQKVVCKKERPTGSRIPTKVCMTKAEWEAATDAAQEALRARGADRSVTDNRIGAPGSGG